MSGGYFLAPALRQLQREVDALWPGRDRASDGWIGDASHQARPSDHNPDWSSGGIVRAYDIDEDLVAGLTAAGEAMPLVAQIIRDARVAYVIYEGRIWQNPAAMRRGGWLPYTGPNAHRHHVHVSVRRGAAWDRDARPWGLIRATANAAGVHDITSLPDPNLTPVQGITRVEDDDMQRIIVLEGSDAWAMTDGLTKRILAGWPDVQLQIDLGVLTAQDAADARDGRKNVSRAHWDLYPTVASPQVVLTAEQVAQIVAAARDGAEDGVRGLSFVTTVAAGS